MNDVKKEYESIIEQARLNPPEGYSERHHVIPKSLGGSDESENIIRLSARDHYLCHVLLTKMFDSSSVEHRKMVFALHKMTFGLSNESYQVTAIEYASIRELNAKSNV